MHSVPTSHHCPEAWTMVVVNVGPPSQAPGDWTTARPWSVNAGSTASRTAASDAKRLLKCGLVESKAGALTAACAFTSDAVNSSIFSLLFICPSRILLCSLGVVRSTIYIIAYWMPRVHGTPPFFADLLAVDAHLARRV